MDTPEDREESTKPPEFTVVTRRESPGFLERVHRSCRDFDFYRVPLVESGWAAARYLLKLLVLVGLIIGSTFAYQLWLTTDEILRDIRSQMPVVHYENGTLTVEAETPYRITAGDGHEFILDPRGTLNRLQLEKNVRVVVVNGAVYVREGTGEFTAWPMKSYFPQEGHTTVTATTVAEWNTFVKGVVAAGAVLATLLAVILQNVIRILFISVGGWLGASGNWMRWNTVLKISSYAVTPVILVETVLRVLSMEPPFARLLYLGFGLFWVYAITQHLQDGLVGPDDEEQSDADSGNNPF